MKKTDKKRPGRISELRQDPWMLPWEKVAEQLNVNLSKGLSRSQVKSRRNQFGPNRLRVAKSKSAWVILVDQFKSFIMLLLVIAAALSFVFNQILEGVSICVAIVLNAFIGFFTELKAVRSMEALHQMSRTKAKVRRENSIQEISAESLVPGDVVLLEGGDIVGADLRLVEASRMQVDEAALTGESIAVKKTTDVLSGETPLADRKNMLFKGTSLVGGSGKGIVVSTGMETELGKVADLAEEAANDDITPLERRLENLGHKLIWVTIVIAFLIVVSGIIAGKDILLIVETAIALAVAAIPEGLPIVATLALTRGMWRMARHNALMNRLAAVETLGTTSIICTDKTGTLTENRMNVTELALADSDRTVSVTDEKGFSMEGKSVDPSSDIGLREALEVGVLCNNAGLKNEKDGKLQEGVGDPMEIALLMAGAKSGIRRSELLKKYPEAREEAFDSRIKMMATYHDQEQQGGYRIAVKGSPESVIEHCSFIRKETGKREITPQDQEHWINKNSKLAKQGLRVLAIASKDVDSDVIDAYTDLTFLGLLGLIDPPRSDVPEAIESCKSAGIRVVMVTGDQCDTARYVGMKVGLVDSEKASVIHGSDISSDKKISNEEHRNLIDADIFARVSPKQKLDIITLHQKAGDVVAMTGDGINDAPALKKANIGVAMGRRGTQVAREAADMILKDDAFSTIVVAIEQGRAIFDNIRKFILYLLSGNVAEIMIVALALLANAPLPLLPLQILYLNMIGDVFPALALGVGKGDPSKMEKAPRGSKEPILALNHWLEIIIYGLIISAAVLTAFYLSFTWLKLDTKGAVTVSFLTLAFARLWHVFNMRDKGTGVIRNDVSRNPFVWGALGLCFGLLLLAVYVPSISLALNMAKPSPTAWGVIVGMSLLPYVLGQFWHIFFAQK
jgi:Ca2+-transporting ATPase